MRKNRKMQERILKNAIVIGSVSIAMLLLVIGSFLFLKNKIVVDHEFEEETIGKNDEEIITFESASTEIGKTVEEAKNEIEEENIVNEVISENVSANSNIGNNAQKTNEFTENKKESNKKQSDVNEEIKEEEKKQIKFIAPVKGQIIREFAADSLVYSETLQEWIIHKGVDIKADKTTVVVAACDGKVQSIKNDPRYGLTVIISHDEGYKTVYANLLTAEFVVEGEEVTEGQTIGTVGNTASFEINDDYHLHFELLKDNEWCDPTIFVDFE